MERVGSTWDLRYGELIAYRDKMGDCNVPQGCPENPALGSWVSNQRTSLKKNRLSPEQVARLEAVGFAWDFYDAEWEAKYQALLAYRATHGDCLVSQASGQHRALAAWVNLQRGRRRNGRVSSERIVRLDELGFSWDVRKVESEEELQALQAYRALHGHCDVSRHYRENRALGVWVGTRRKARRKNLLSPEEIARLDGLGFNWDPFEDRWDLQFQALSAYRRIHGDCNVPRAGNSDLASWVRAQRRSRAKNLLSPARSTRLDQLGFEWEPRK